MENASKALIIAGEILIGIFILSLAVYVARQFGTFSRNINQDIDETKIAQFNVNFTNFEYRVNISAQEIVSIINFAKKNNEEMQAEKGDAYFVDVFLDNDTNSILNINTNEFMANNKNFYSCNLKVNGSSDFEISAKETKVEVKATKTNTDILDTTNTKMINKIIFHTIKNTTNTTDYYDAMLKGYNIDLKFKN